MHVRFSVNNCDEACIFQYSFIDIRYKISQSNHLMDNFDNRSFYFEELWRLVGICLKNVCPSCSGLFMDKP